MDKICILGAGSWGSALGILLAKKGYEVQMWTNEESQCEDVNKTRENIDFLPGVIIPQNMNLSIDLQDSIKGATAIVMAVPSQAVREVIRLAKPYISKDQIIVNVAKGLERKTNLRISQVVEEELEGNSFAVLSGPSHAEEVAKDVPTTVVVASNEMDVAEVVQDIFISPKFRVYTNADLVGVELGGSLKNIIAFAAGVSDGLGYGDNTKAALMTRGLTEIVRLGVAMGAKAETFSGLSGIGDLIVTCTSMHSRNRRAGMLIGQGKSLEEALAEVKMVVEGVEAAKVAYGLSVKYDVEMPITSELHGVLFGGKDVKKSVIDLMMRSKTHEIEDLSI